ncbi:MAG TPA: VOC family protein [Stellaceae bacterium]|nr:VOC family protein [Stellaceae bacterium]
MTIATEPDDRVDGPPKTGLTFSHVSVPCRDIAAGKRFYTAVLGGTVRVDTPDFVALRVFDTEIGIGSVGTTFVGHDSEYPHFAFFAGPGEMLRMKAWLTRCGIPTSNFWTRHGVEALMFFRDPSGNLIELFCEHGFTGADKLPRGPARGHGTAVDVTALHYRQWQVPDVRS